MADYNLGTASGRIVVDGSAAEYGFKVAQNAAGAFFDAVRGQVDQIQTLGKRMAGVGAAGVGGFGIAVKAASGFEAQMSGVKAVANATEEEFEALRQKALQLGADTAFSASEAGLALEELVKAGVGIEDVLSGAADATVALAAAGGISLPEAATIAANAMNAFGMSAKEVPEVADILAGVANKGAADVSSLGSSLSQAGAVANLAGLSLRDTAIALGELSDAGINGSDAGTSLKTMLNNLIPVTDKQVKKFEELGLLEYDLAKANKVLAKEGLKQADSIDEVNKRLEKYVDNIGLGNEGTARNSQAIRDLLMQNGALSNQFFDQQGNVKNLAGLQAQLANAVKGMTKQQKLANLEILFGADSMRAAAVMAAEGRKGVKDYDEALASTSAAEVAAVRLENLSGSVEAMSGSMETALITIGNIFLPLVTKVVDGVTAMINVFNNMPPALQKTIAIIGAIASAGLLLIGVFIAALPVILGFLANMLLMRGIMMLLRPFGAFFGLLRGGAGVIASFGALFARLGAALMRIWRVLSLVVPAFKIISFVIGLMSAPVLAAVAAVAALIAIGVILYKKWAPFREFIDSLVASIKDKFQAALAAIRPIIASVLDAFKRFGQFVAATLIPVLREVGGQLLEKLRAGWERIKTAAMGLIGPIKSFVAALSGAGDAGGSLLEKVMPFFERLGSIISTYVLPALVAFGTWFVSTLLPILIKVAGFIGGFLIDTIVSAVEGIIQAVGGIISIVTGIINFFVGLFTGNWSKMWSGVKQIFTGIWDLIVGALKTYLAVGILKLVGLAFSLLRGIVMGGLRFILTIFQTILRGVWNFVKFIFNAIVAGVRGYIGLWVSIVRAGINLVRSIISTVLRGIVAIVRGIWNFITGIFRGATSNITGGVSRAWTFLKNTTQAAFTRFWEIIRTIVTRVINFFKELPGKIVDAIKGMGSRLWQAGKDMMQGLIDGIKSMGDAVVGAAGDIAKGAGDAIVEFFKIGSPSKLMREYGSFGGEGLALGFTDEEKTVAKSAVETARAALIGFEATLDPKALRAMSASLVTSPVVAPVRPNRVTTRPTTGKQRLVEGELRLDPSGRAFIRGVAEEAYGDTEHLDSVIERMY